MFLINESPIGQCIVFMAPKTGATSLTQMASSHNIKHRNISDFHETETSVIKGRSVVITIRDPRERLLSLWKHYCNEFNNVPLNQFMEIQHSQNKFFKSPLYKWYEDLLRLDKTPQHELHFLRLEHFAADTERLLGWSNPVHINTTDHGPWAEYKEDLETTDWWKRDLELFSDPASHWSFGLDHEKLFWTEWVKKDIQWVKEVRNIKPMMENLVSWTESTEVLDVASGAVSMFGRLCNGIVFKIIQADALESWFANLVPSRPNEAHQVKGEDLKQYFGDRKFDAVVSSNGIDHSADPKTVLENMAAVSKGPIYLEHYRNCAVLNHWKGLHQWNFDIREGRVILWSQGIQLDIANILGITNWESGLKKEGKHWVVWFKGWKTFV